MTDMTEAEFGSAVTKSLLDALSSGLCPQLTKALGDVVGSQSSRAKSKSPEPTISHAKDHSRSRSRGRKEERGRSRSYRSRSRSDRRRRLRSHHRHRSRSSSLSSRSRDRHDRRKRPNKLKRVEERCDALMHRYSKRDYDKARVHFEVNEMQLSFNEKVVYDVHKIAQMVEDDPKESIRMLANLKKKVLDRQENIVVADTCGMGCGRYVENPDVLQISKEKQKLVAAYKRMNPSGDAPSSQSHQAKQPFHGPGGGQPCEFTTTQQRSYSGPFTKGNQDSTICYHCSEVGHYANRCPQKFGQAAFGSTSGGSTQGIKPLFNTKRY